jgi:hypothetical protein
MSTTMRRRLSLTPTLLAFCSGVFLLGAATVWAATAHGNRAGAANVVTFGLQPASSTKPDSRGYFSVGATPGAHVSDHVAVTNYSYQKLRLTLSASDGLNTSQGDFALLPPTQRSIQVGTWIHLPQSLRTVDVPPRGFVVVPFTIVVPKNAGPGDHAGGIIATLESFARSQTGQTYRLLQNVGSRVFVRISGALHAELKVEGVHVHYLGKADPLKSGHAIVTYTVHNVGNVVLGGRQSVRVVGLLGLGRSAHGIRQLGVLLPGFTATQTVDVGGVIPQIWMTAHVSISPLVLPGTVQTLHGPYTGSGHFWAIPWVLLGIIILLIGGIWWRRRRPRRTTPPAETAPAASTTTPVEDQAGIGDERTPAEEPADVHVSTGSEQTSDDVKSAPVGMPAGDHATIE